MRKLKKIRLEWYRLRNDRRNNTTGFIFLCFFRISRIFFILNVPILTGIIKVGYTLTSRAFFCLDVPLSVEIQSEVLIFHTIGIVIFSGTRIRRFVKIRQNTTIGQHHQTLRPLKIPRGSDFGANSVILADENLRPNWRVRAGTVIFNA
jgi:serine acetyltransferase